jgi:hypothetical protein
LNVVKLRRSGKTLIAMVRCAAASSASCLSTVAASTGGRRLATKTVYLRGGKSASVRFSLAKLATNASTHTRGVTVKVTARTGSYANSKSKHFVLAAHKRHR